MESLFTIFFIPGEEKNFGELEKLKRVTHQGD